MADAPPQPRHRWFAALYDRMDRSSDRRMQALRRRLLGGVSGRVLEIGCGTGNSFEHYDWSQIASVDATEPDPFMLQRAREKAARLGGAVGAKLTLTEAPAEALPFPEAAFDFVISSLVLCSVADPARALAEIRRVLKPGGELRLLEHVAAEGAWRTVQGAIQAPYGWLSAGCRLDRRTEEAVRDTGFALEVWERVSFSPLHPAVLGVGRKAPS